MIFDLPTDINITVSATTVAWYAALIGSFGGIKALIDIWNDRGRIKIVYKPGMVIRNARGMYDENKKYLSTEVINKGRRPVKITHVGAKFFDQEETSLFADSFIEGVDRTLTETNPTTSYLTDQSDMSLKKLWYVYAVEAKGKEFRNYSNNLAWHIRVYYKVRKHKNNIKKSEPKFGFKK